MLKKLFIVLGATCAGLTAAFGLVFLLEKRREKQVGGKLIRVNYRFSKDFDD